MKGKGTEESPEICAKKPEVSPEIGPVTVIHLGMSEESHERNENLKRQPRLLRLLLLLFNINWRGT